MCTFESVFPYSGKYCTKMIFYFIINWYYEIIMKIPEHMIDCGSQ